MKSVDAIGVSDDGRTIRMRVSSFVELSINLCKKGINVLEMNYLNNNKNRR